MVAHATVAVVAQAFRFTCAVEGWRGAERAVFGRSHALALGLLQAVDRARAAALHDGDARKPWALSPLCFEPRANGLATLTVEIACWEPELTSLLADACAIAPSAPLHALGHLLQPLDFRPVDRAVLALSVEPPSAPFVAVCFQTPTLFGLGRTLGGAQRYGLLPQPGLVVGSWARAWARAAGPAFDAPLSPEWWDDRLVVRHVADLRTVTVSIGKALIAGFLGQVAYEWSGPEPWGPALLQALAAFARFCGTGAKTGLGFGQTRTLHPAESRFGGPVC
jgi:CRISPR-associated endoribonuclease Cas6